MKHKYLKIKQLKRGIQIRNKSNQILRDTKLVYGFETTDNLAMNKSDFFNVAKALNIEPITKSNYSSSYKYHSHFYLEGKEIYCIYNDKPELKGYYAREYKDKYKEFFFETEDKQKAFELTKEHFIDKARNKRSHEIYWMKSYKDLEKFFNRHSIENESYKSRYSKYTDYKETFESLDSYISWGEAERERPDGDYFYPLTFKQWNKANY